MKYQFFFSTGTVMQIEQSSRWYPSYGRKGFSAIFFPNEFQQPSPQ
ncbi:hypothetical protein NIB75_23030 [Bacteroides uniformis]|nr:hypothetical protein [Bacteroides uniformis]